MTLPRSFINIQYTLILCNYNLAQSPRLTIMTSPTRHIMHLSGQIRFGQPKLLYIINGESLSLLKIMNVQTIFTPYHKHCSWDHWLRMTLQPWPTPCPCKMHAVNIRKYAIYWCGCILMLKVWNLSSTDHCYQLQEFILCI